jgi:hypothetical protein
MQQLRRTAQGTTPSESSLVDIVLQSGIVALTVPPA